MTRREQIKYYDFKSYLKAHYEYISKFDALMMNAKLYQLPHVQVLQICNDLYGV